MTKAHLEGYYYKPRMDKELLEEHHEGIIALSGCHSGEVPRLLADGPLGRSVEAARWYKEVFGDFYIEVQEHNIPEAEQLNREAGAPGAGDGLPLVATNDVHYVRREDAPFHDILLCIGTNTSVLDEKRMRMAGDSDSYYLKSEEEMRALFPELPEAIDNTWRIAEMCDLSWSSGGCTCPRPTCRRASRRTSTWRSSAARGWPRRYPQADAGGGARAAWSTSWTSCGRRGSPTTSWSCTTSPSSPAARAS